MQHNLVCHLRSDNTCSNVASHGWIFLFSYVLFARATANLLFMCKNAVFTVAMATASLRLSGILWSIYNTDIGSNGSAISWLLGVTGQLTCALLGLPVVLLGLGLLIRSHIRDADPSHHNIKPLDVPETRVTGAISWSLGVTGQLTCALLGLPVVLLGLGLLIRSHIRGADPSHHIIKPLDVHRDTCHR